MQRFTTLCLMAALATLAAPAFAQTPDNEFRQCLNGLRPTAQANGVNETTFRAHTDTLQPMMSVIGNLDAQPEFKTPIWDYLTVLVDPQRVDEGAQRLQANAELLQRVQQRFGVDPATVVAVWGVESNYGQGFGKTPIVQSLATLSCYGRRQAYFRTEFYSALRLLQAGHFPPERLQGSWAGAFGHTQFMPSTYERLAVDFDGDGRADLIDSIPDALASTANFLQRAGWRNDLPWGFEVKLPEGLSVLGEGRRSKRPGTEWAARGVMRIDGTPVPPELSLGLLTPAGAKGPAFLVTRNFDAIYSYNAAESYGLAIAHLADRLRGGGPFVTPWPTDDLGLTRAERRELQTLLLARGHDIGEADGLLGEKTRSAVRAEQTRLGWEANGRAGQKLLKALRGG
ncbi:MAG TPA: lytic murein transglycosylase [Hydrogenophaga sp.]|uniref:lytic murein transglycosylase n=1 Tax=Hydrogenophaga sp. TaxID=1904254 RepID=UPI002CF99B80|nr:lytic murein transglycosylase [Hydrogenophaga sp.]HSX93099.1 lytic murein transglycosylase [Hydrogenophaga sp.]